MKVFIVAVPLFDSSMVVKAYRLCDRSSQTALDSKRDYRGISDMFLSPGLDLIERIGLEPFAGDKPLFVDINRFQLLTGFPTNMDIDPAKIVCVLPAGMQIEQEELERCRQLQEAGYALAVDGIAAEGAGHPLAPYLQYILLDCMDQGFFKAYREVQQQLPHIQLVLSNIPDLSAYKTLSRNQSALFSGQFYNQPITAGITEISPVKVNALQLIRQVNEDDFELEDTARIVERDPALSISLLRFINSGAVGLRRKVSSINSAIAILGQQEVRRWATVAISVSLAQDRPGEITKLSLVRARFAENLAGIFELGMFQNSLFMTGLFSLLDVILQKPMAEAIEEVAVDKRVHQALVEHSGELYPVLELIFTYEKADWDAVSMLLIRNGLRPDDVNKAFVDALVWYHSMLQNIDEEEQTPEAEGTKPAGDTPP